MRWTDHTGPTGLLWKFHAVEPKPIKGVVVPIAEKEVWAAAGTYPPLKNSSSNQGRMATLPWPKAAKYHYREGGQVNCIMV